MDKIKIGYAPTRRSIFSAPDAVKYRGLTAKRLEELGVDFVDITDINDEGLYNDEGLEKIIAKFKKRRLTDFSFRTATSVQSMSVQDLQKRLMFRSFCGDLWMRDLSRTEQDFVIHSADFLQQVSFKKIPCSIYIHDKTAD